MGIVVFGAQNNGCVVIDMTKVEAVTKDDNGIVLLMTSTDSYRVTDPFDEVVEKFKLSRRSNKE